MGEGAINMHRPWTTAYSRRRKRAGRNALKGKLQFGRVGGAHVQRCKWVEIETEVQLLQGCMVCFGRRLGEQYHKATNVILPC